MPRTAARISIILLCSLILHTAAVSAGTDGAVVTVTGDAYDPPYVFINENGEPDGFNVQIFNAVANAVGIRAVIKLTTWSEARNSIENGMSDIMLGMYYSERRDRLLDFTRPLMTAMIVVFTRKETGIHSLEDIRGRKTVVIQSDIMHDYLLDNNTGAVIITVDTREQAMSMLIDGGCDCMLGVLAQGHRVSGEYIPDGIIAVGEQNLPMHYCFAVGEGDTELLARLEEGLDIINKSGAFREIHRQWLKDIEDSGGRFRRIVKYILTAMAFLLLLVLTLFLWSRSLRRQVMQRTESLSKELAERMKAEEALRISDEKYRGLFETTRDALVLSAPDGTIIDANTSWLELYGFKRDEALGANIRMVYSNPDDREKIVELFDTVGYIIDYEVVHLKKDGTGLICLLTANVRKGPDGKIVYYQTNVRDITRQRQLEHELVQAQKMESVGRLAGGIAHDFNNLLTIIMGNADFAIIKAGDDSPVGKELKEILKTSGKASEMIRQLLTFSRSQTADAEIVNIGKVLLDMQTMLKPLIGENILLEIDIGKPLWNVKINPSQLEQVITNLVVNARDAMPDGGELSMTAKNVRFGKDMKAASAGIEYGDYVVLTVRDTGHGIPTELHNRIFEPFFTTKEIGKGTGLGLSTCYGIIQRAGGTITVESKPGRETVFLIYLPKNNDPVPEVETPGQASASGGGGKKILVVEDETSLRRMIVELLTNKGFVVFDAESGEHAIEIVKECGHIDILLTDIIMPGMNGRALAEILSSDYGCDRVLYISGYTGEEVDLPDSNFLMKPFRTEDLLVKINEVLARS